ncbi:MAG: PilZ domain-containing protein [Planctomycetota bacterium]
MRLRPRGRSLQRLLFRRFYPKTTHSSRCLRFCGFHVVDGTSLVTTGDRRRFPRRQSECMVTVLERRQTDQLTPQQIDRWLQAGRSVGRLLDISQAGLCLLLDREIAKDTEVLLRISNQQLNRHIDCTATVVHSHLTGQGRFSIHCRVLNEFTLSDLQDLGRPLAVGHVLA